MIQIEKASEVQTGVIYCRTVTITGHESVHFNHVNTITNEETQLQRSPEETVTDGCYTLEQQEQLAALLQIGCDFYASFEIALPIEDVVG